jgi:bifunctional DNA-binding transcriptional regulator/antitoxin component of YhaV-PrlF toxin-antitoxin module
VPQAPEYGRIDKPDVEFSRLTGKGQYTLPRRIRDYVGVGPSDQVAWILTEHGVLVKKRIVQTDTLPQKSPADALRELVLAIGREAQMQGLSEENVEQDIRH